MLLVMPTGAGKSLCYQLPGLARQGTTLVVSPLIALMEDQVQKLVQVGLAAERIHSGRDRSASRQACVDYLRGNLDYLFIAPERLRVPGFPEMLAKKQLALIAVDEAHCISNWGHDFRPEYRMLGQRLGMLRQGPAGTAAPVIALTATATAEVQDDIVHQLNLDDAERFIHGFRRKNLAIEVVTVTVGERPRVAKEVLESPKNRPAIVYAPTRKDAESLAASLADTAPSAAYHAGLSASEREKVQTAFLQGQLEIVVATIAFGMGVDKPDVRTVIHMALPGSVEAYYQEIGRAGRDGLPSRALLLQSYYDRRMHQFFFDRDYPETAVLERLFEGLGEKWIEREALADRCQSDSDLADEDVRQRALTQLFIHHGAAEDQYGYVRRGKPGWQRGYAVQREHKRADLDRMMGFAESSACRMVELVRHFGDQEDSGARCGTCDACAPGACVVRRFRKPNAAETAAIERLISALRTRDGVPKGRLFRESLEGVGGITRDTYEDLLGALARIRVVTIEPDELEKDGETIRFDRVFLSGEALQPGFAPSGVLLDRAGSATGTKDKKKKSTKKTIPPWIKRRAARDA